jgi:hypothetical protein
VAIFPLYRRRQVVATIQSPIIPRELRMPKHNVPAQDKLSGFRIPYRKAKGRRIEISIREWNHEIDGLLLEGSMSRRLL